MATIGKRNILTVVRGSSPGLYLDGDEDGEILLPNRYVPQGIKMGGQIEVFVYRDSEGRLVATTETPRATVGEVATLKSDRHQSSGRSVFGLEPGQGFIVALPGADWSGSPGPDCGRAHLYRSKNQRIVASMKLDRNPAVEPPDYRSGQPVEFLITEKTDLGYKALVEGKHSGLIYHDGLSVPVAVGK